MGSENKNCFGYFLRTVGVLPREKYVDIPGIDFLKRNNLEIAKSPDVCEGLFVTVAKGVFTHALVRHKVKGGDPIYSHRDGVRGGVEFLTEGEYLKHFGSFKMTPIKRRRV